MDDFLQRLSRLDSCAVSDALDKLGLAGAVSGIHRFSTDRRISGRVVTVKLERDDGRPAASRHLGTTAIESAQPGDVIVVEQRTGIDAAGWGGNLSCGAQIKGIAGVIIDGPGRDMDEARQYDFPVFARDHTARTARGRIVETGTNVPISVGDVQVTPGDYVVADGSGVVFVAAPGIERVLEAAEAIAARERAMVAALKDGTPITQVMGRSYETMLKGGG
ncbi:MAG TPA: RraA family protein [Vicinamibacterales bacterium]|nr:RraA family protein [Vicinamibacterales bacterium]